MKNKIFTMEQLGTIGTHSVEIQNGDMTLIGMFSTFRCA